MNGEKINKVSRGEFESSCLRIFIVQWESQSFRTSAYYENEERDWSDEKYNLYQQNGSMGTHKGKWTLNRRVNRSIGQKKKE